MSSCKSSQTGYDMPTYDYRCSECGHTFEGFAKMSDPVTIHCSRCEKLTATRLIGAGCGLVFKGDGWYRSDNYKAGAKKNE